MPRLSSLRLSGLHLTDIQTFLYSFLYSSDHIPSDGPKGDPIYFVARQQYDNAITSTICIRTNDQIRGLECHGDGVWPHGLDRQVRHSR